MGKYSDGLTRSVLASTDSSPLGVQLGRLCIETNLPAAYVAQVLGVSRMSLHTWFRGGKIRTAKVEKILVFMKLVKEDKGLGVLPAKDNEAARAYLQDMVDVPITRVSQKKED